MKKLLRSRKFCWTIAALLVVAAGLVAYVSYGMIAREQKTVPIATSIEDIIQSEWMPYTIAAATQSAFEDALQEVYLPSFLQGRDSTYDDYNLLVLGRKTHAVLNIKDPHIFLHAGVSSADEKTIQKTFLAKNITLRGNNYTSSPSLTKPESIYWVRTFEGNAMVTYTEVYEPPSSSLRHGGGGTFKTISSEGVTFKYAAILPFQIGALGIGGSLLIAAYFLLFCPTIFKERKNIEASEGG